LSPATVLIDALQSAISFESDRGTWVRSADKQGDGCPWTLPFKRLQPSFAANPPPLLVFEIGGVTARKVSEGIRGTAIDVDGDHHSPGHHGRDDSSPPCPKLFTCATTRPDADCRQRPSPAYRSTFNVLRNPSGQPSPAPARPRPQPVCDRDQSSSRLSTNRPAPAD